MNMDIKTEKYVKKVKPNTESNAKIKDFRKPDPYIV